MNFTPAYFIGSNEIVIVGQNYEMADYDNPRGYIHGLQPKVSIANEYGDRYTLAIGKPITGVTSYTEREANEMAEQFAACLQARWEKLGKLPIGFDSWQQDRPIYGSQAYIDYGADDDIALERREAEEEAWA
jgi:hypothetical protein